MPGPQANVGAHGIRRSCRAAEFRRTAFEAGARRSPFGDLPLCLGGTQSSLPNTLRGTPSDFVKSELCLRCPLDASCPGAPGTVQELISEPLASVLKPLPTWHVQRQLPRVLILS